MGKIDILSTRNRLCATTPQVAELLTKSSAKFDSFFAPICYYINLYSPKNSLVTTDRDRQIQKHTE